MRTNYGKLVFLLAFAGTILPLLGGLIVQYCFSIFIPSLAWVCAGVVSFYVLSYLRKAKQQFEALQIEFHPEDEYSATKEPLRVIEHACEVAQQAVDDNSVNQSMIEEPFVLHTSEAWSPQFIVENCQHAILLLTSDRHIKYINQSLLELIQVDVDSIDSWVAKSLSELIIHQNPHFSSMLEQAFNSSEPTRFLHEGSKSSDWSVVPLKFEEQVVGYIVEANSPSHHEIFKLDNQLTESNAKLKKAEIEMTSFVNAVDEVQFYYKKPGYSTKSLDPALYHHPMLKKSAGCVKKLADQLVEMQKEATNLREHMRAMQLNPDIVVNQTSVLSQAIVRNLEEFKRDYCDLIQQHAGYLRIVNEQKGITEGLNSSLNKGSENTGMCRRESLSGFEAVTLTLQNLQHFENQIELISRSINDMAKRIQTQALEPRSQQELSTLMLSLSEQAKHALNIAKRNKNALNLLIPSYSEHHFHIGKIHLQWQHAQGLLESQMQSLSEWRSFGKSIANAQSGLNTRIQELFNLAEKLLSKTRTIDGHSVAKSEALKDLADLYINLRPVDDVNEKFLTQTKSAVNKN